MRVKSNGAMCNPEYNNQESCRRRPKWRLWSAVMVCLLVAVPMPARADRVSFPLRIDYKLLRSLVIQSAFPSPGQSAILEDESDPCRKITISEPRFFVKNAKFQFETRLRVSAGTEFAGKCMLPVVWEGYLVLFQTPRVDRRTWVLSFESQDSELLNTHHDPTKLPDVIWGIIETQVFDYLKRIKVNLAPPVSDLKSFLLPLFDKDAMDRAQQMLDSLRPGKIETLQEGMTVDLSAEAEKIEKEPRPGVSETISEEELASFVSTWEAWDAFLVQIFQSLSQKSLSVDERRIIFSTLLDTRHRFVQELSEKNASKRDFVREQFATAWQQLSPVFRNHLGNEPSKSVLGYLAFFTAADALSGLDQLGPSFGFEISRDGLIRLAKLLGDLGSPIELLYKSDVDPVLRNILGMGPPIIVAGPAFDADSIGNGLPEIEETILPDPEKSEAMGLSKAVLSFIMKPCWAEDKIPDAEIAAIRQWVLSPDNIEDRLEQIKIMINEAVDETLKKNTIPTSYQPVFLQAVSATGWQESCFRQFLEKKGKITYLLSYNNTSVGMMQVNERVWRGLYDLKHLRWNIRYNARAGCEILEQYFTRYALSYKKSGQLDPDTMACALYAMYNSGPGDFQKFLQRNTGGKRQLTDKLFQEKYTWVKNDQWNHIKKCLGGT
ncbi:MAG: lytic transglycosylase domain-containing protein [Deltaproteobacteria bacterium]|nr:lytic transglycosylase domain-containing protein [Deltaproteobacteria bacterium]